MNNDKFTISFFEKNGISDNKIVVQYFLASDFPNGKWIYDAEANTKLRNEEYDLDEFVNKYLMNFINKKDDFLFTQLYVQKAHVFVSGNTSTLFKFTRLINDFDKRNSTICFHEPTITSINLLNASFIEDAKKFLMELITITDDIFDWIKNNGLVVMMKDKIGRDIYYNDCIEGLREEVHKMRHIYVFLCLNYKKGNKDIMNVIIDYWTILCYEIYSASYPNMSKALAFFKGFMVDSSKVEVFSKNIHQITKSIKWMKEYRNVKGGIAHPRKTHLPYKENILNRSFKYFGKNSLITNDRTVQYIGLMTEISSRILVIFYVFNWVTRKCASIESLMKNSYDGFISMIFPKNVFKL